MTIVHKNIRNSWCAEDTIDLVANRVLKISTHTTSSKALVTSATVHTKSNGFLSHMVYQDFSQRVIVAHARCSEKNVAAQHAEAMSKINEIHSAITAWYAKKDEAVTV